MECFGGWEKGELGEARGRGGQQGGAARVAGASRGGQHGPGGGCTGGAGQGRAGGDLHLIKQKYNFKKIIFIIKHIKKTIIFFKRNKIK